MRTEEQTRRCPAANYASNTASRPTGPDHDKSPSASETRICTQPDNLLSWIPEHMGDKRKRVDAPTVRPLNVVSLRTTVAQVDMLLAYAYRAAFFISWSKRLLGCSAPLRSAPLLLTNYRYSVQFWPAPRQLGPGPIYNVENETQPGRHATMSQTHLPKK